MVSGEDERPRAVDERGLYVLARYSGVWVISAKRTVSTSPPPLPLPCESLLALPRLALALPCLAVSLHLSSHANIGIQRRRDGDRGRWA